MADSPKKSSQAQNVQMSFKIDPDKEGGSYCNSCNLFNTRNEFIIDFCMNIPGAKYIKIISRIITSPVVAKSIAQMLSNSVRKYEQRFGEIEMPSPSVPVNKKPKFMN